ncbi:MAG: hypothetical protein PHE08_12105 [Bacteroidales bacterium]|nr:hypothetical protein [Bacteroidales bacterium]
MKKIYVLLVILLCSVTLAACNKPSVETDDTVYAYCSEYYNVSYGNYGTFSIVAADDNELVTNFNDLSGFVLEDAFTGMEILNASYNSANASVTFTVSGTLTEGDYGTIEGKGIVIGKSVKVYIPIAQAEANSDNVIYENSEEQQVVIELTNACFNQSITADNFVLSGAAKNMQVKSVETDYEVIDGEEILSQTAKLVLTGKPDGSDYAYINIYSNATTYNKDLTVVLGTGFYGAYILNDHIDTFELSEYIYVEANNITFNTSINKENIKLEGVFKDYAVIDYIDFVNEELIGIKLNFPYAYVNETDTVGLISFDNGSNNEGIAFLCSVTVEAPEIDYELEKDGDNISIKLTLDYEEFKDANTYSYTFTDINGDTVKATNVKINNMGEYLDISFTLPKDYSGFIYFELDDVYDIIKPNGVVEDISILLVLYIQ